MLIFVSSAYSDFGNFSGNSDYGSSSNSSSTSSGGGFSSSSSSSSESYGRRHRRSGTDDILPFAAGAISGGVSGNDLNDYLGVGFVLLVAFVFWIFIRITSKKSKHVLINTNAPVRNLRPMNEYLELDPEFDEEKIKTLMSNLYVQMQDTWHAKDISSLRPYMTDEFFNQMDRQLDAFRKTGRTDYTERIAVLNVGLKGWRQSAGMDYITVGLTSRIVSYVLEDRTGKLLSGDMNREKFMEYEIELSRKSGVITNPESDSTKTVTCPHCGAPLKLNASAKCEYCGSVITTVNSDWAICGMRGISQRTL